MRSTHENLQVLYEDNHLIAVNKRPGDIVQGDRTGDRPLSEWVKQYIAEKYDKPGKVFLGVVHRLDRPTSGVVIFARTSKALERMNKMLRDRQVEKAYRALVAGHPPLPSRAPTPNGQCCTTRSCVAWIATACSRSVSRPGGTIRSGASSLSSATP